MKAKKWLAVLCVLGVVISYSTMANAEWHFGIGTGLFRLNMDGDIALNTDVRGTVEFDVDLDADDIDDLMESAFGFAGYATDGQWIIEYSLGQLRLEGDTSASLSGGASVSSELDFDKTTGELTVGFLVAENDRISLRVHSGLRYTNHEWDADITVVDGGGTTHVAQDIDEDWADVLFGASADIPLAKKWTWNNRLEAGFSFTGNGETYVGSTGISWRFFEHWSAALYGKYAVVDYDNDDRDDPYAYDVDEFGVGLGVLFHW